MSTKITTKYNNYFCSICWRPVNCLLEKTKYCRVHMQPEGAKQYKRRLRQLRNAYGADGKGMSPSEIFSSLESKRKSVDNADREIATAFKSVGNTNLISLLKKSCAHHYRSAFDKITFKNSERFADVASFGEAIVRANEDRFPNEFAIHWRDNCKLLTLVEQRKLILHLFLRIDLECTINSVLLERGPKIGEARFNTEVFADLLKIYDKKADYSIRQLSTKHQMSRQAMYVKWKKLVANPNVYRKAIRLRNKKQNNLYTID